jgi:hypothetical protein
MRTAEPLIYADAESWDRGNVSQELIAYPSLVVDPINASVMWFYYTYLEPGAGFRDR